MFLPTPCLSPLFLSRRRRFVRFGLAFFPEQTNTCLHGVAGCPNVRAHIGHNRKQANSEPKPQNTWVLVRIRLQRSAHHKNTTRHSCTFFLVFLSPFLFPFLFFFFSTFVFSLVLRKEALRCLNRNVNRNQAQALTGKPFKRLFFCLP